MRVSLLRVAHAKQRIKAYAAVRPWIGLTTVAFLRRKFRQRQARKDRDQVEYRVSRLLQVDQRVSNLQLALYLRRGPVRHTFRAHKREQHSEGMLGPAV